MSPAATRVLDTAAPVPTAPLDPGTVLAGAPAAGSRALAAVSGVEVGVWEMTPGTATDVEVDEVFVVLSGAASVTFDDGEQVELGPGSVVRLRAGEHTTWVVHETIRKIYVA
ncbi:cupin domain-containing protein [Nocardioides sp. zg-1228]|uniref:cupin domain-containing protein n=1 Tax=Nocardioides sp. zg-1228 TaxID=2763008 RepID=UPI0016433F3E|nr:cupin domain-containing protein [Nocardioides sp. zg-1228]MBC2932558.1 cupin domain-containing protein [Nocardioides sp. zg-1228]QSF58055.1 cupin domain-containing protein [Nocardioides sp. zg-1228]